MFGALSIKIADKKRSEATRTRLLWIFRGFYRLQILSWVLFFPGLFVLSFYSEVPRPLFLFDFMIMPISILGAGIAGLMYDKTIVEPSAAS